MLGRVDNFLKGKVPDPRNLYRDCKKHGISDPRKMIRDELDTEVAICTKELENSERRHQNYVETTSRASSNRLRHGQMWRESRWF